MASLNISSLIQNEPGTLFERLENSDEIDQKYIINELVENYPQWFCSNIIRIFQKVLHVESFKLILFFAERKEVKERRYLIKSALHHILTFDDCKKLECLDTLKPTISLTTFAAECYNKNKEDCFEYLMDRYPVIVNRINLNPHSPLFLRAFCHKCQKKTWTSKDVKENMLRLQNYLLNDKTNQDSFEKIEQSLCHLLRVSPSLSDAIYERLSMTSQKLMREIVYPQRKPQRDINKNVFFQLISFIPQINTAFYYTGLCEAIWFNDHEMLEQCVMSQKFDIQEACLLATERNDYASISILLRAPNEDFTDEFFDFWSNTYDEELQYVLLEHSTFRNRNSFLEPAKSSQDLHTSIAKLNETIEEIYKGEPTSSSTHLTINNLCPFTCVSQDDTPKSFVYISIDDEGRSYWYNILYLFEYIICCIEDSDVQMLCVHNPSKLTDSGQLRGNFQNPFNRSSISAKDVLDIINAYHLLRERKMRM